MERNQKRTTLKIIEYLYDKKLGEDIQMNVPYLILDLGCGTGFSSEVLIQNGFRVIGVDILNDMLTKANQKKENLPIKDIELILADINYLPLKINSINHIISVSAYNFIIHNKFDVREKRKTLNNTARHLNKLLKKNGRIIIEFYPKSEDLDLFVSSFTENGFDGFMVKKNLKQKSGQKFLLLKKKNPI